MTRRTERVNALLRQEISELLLREAKDPRLTGMVTITEVDISADLRTAKVHVSVLGEEKEKQEALHGLAAAAGFLRREMAHRLTLRYIPELTFHLDNSIEQGVHLLQLIRQVSTPEKPEAQPPQKKR